MSKDQAVGDLSVMESLEEWILAKNPEDLQSIPLDYDLIENRIIDSLDVTEFLLFLEEISGQEISFEDFSIDQIRTLENIQKYFFEGT